MKTIDKKTLKENAKKIILEDPSMFGAIRSSLISADTARYAVYAIPENIYFVKNPCFELCRIAVQGNPKTIRLIPIKFQNSLRVLACANDPTLIKFFSEWKKSELESIIEQNPSAIQFIDKPSSSLIKYAIQLNPNVALYYSEESLND